MLVGIGIKCVLLQIKPVMSKISDTVALVDLFFYESFLSDSLAALSLKVKQRMWCDHKRKLFLRPSI